ncbi:MAG: ABC transporter permease [Acidobacteria bacterium]|nr:ABC transporter permease [Acidobacteriota bacterium]
MNNLWQDLRYGARMLFRNPGFTLIAMITLALGIGANTAIFSVVNALLFKPLPYKEPKRLMQLYQTGGFVRAAGGSSGWSYPQFEALRANNQSFESVAAYSTIDLNITGTDEPERVTCEHVSASYFPTLGVNAAVGRTFTPEEDLTPGTHPVALIGYSLWQRRFGADTGIAGKNIGLNKVTYTVVGVLPAGFRGQNGTAEVWMPMMMAPTTYHPRRLIQPYAFWMGIIARLKPNVSLELAQAEMGILASRMTAALPPPPLRAKMEGGAAGVRLVELKDAKTNTEVKKSFLILLAAVGLVLLIACVNMANLILARAVSRQKEVAVRVALGASRGRIVRQFLTENVLIALVGGTAGLLVAVWGIDLLTGFKVEADSGFWASYSSMLKYYDIRLDNQILFFNLVVSVTTGVLFGLIPALRSSRPDLNEALKEGAGSAPESFGRWWSLNVRGVLVVVEIALSFVLLTGAGLMIRSLARLSAVDLGFDSQDVMTFNIAAHDARPEFYQQLHERVAALPGIVSASVASSAPLLGYSSITLMQIEGQEQATSSRDMSAGVHSVSADYFQTLRIPLIKGRPIANTDRVGVQRVAIINETAAKQFWPGGNAIGQRIRLALDWPPNDWAEIIGIVGDVKYETVEEANRADVYLSSLQPAETTDTLIVRSKIDQAALTASVRREAVALDRNVPVHSVRTMNERITEVTSRTRFIAFLLTLFAGLSLTLSAVGIYGVMAYAVTARTRELGIRVALGAQARDVTWLVMGQGLVMILAGMAAGAMAALGATRVLTNQLFGVVTTDAPTFIGVSLVLTIIALLACLLPVRRATKVDPMVALRYE